MELDFAEGKIAGEKVFGDVVFPKTLTPPKGKQGTSDLLVEMVRGNREWLSELLHHHSAILFRGFGVCSPDDFARIVEAFDWEGMDYWGPITRLKVTHGVYSANEAPLDKFISFHHEMPLVKNFPSKIFFFCSQPSPEGGETSIIPSHVIVEKMEEKVPEFVGKVSKLGVTFPAKLPKEDQPGDIISRSWKWLLNTDDQEEAERRALERFRISSTKFNQDGSMEYVFGPWSPIEEFEGRRVWFIPLPDYSKDTDDKQMHYRFGDGSAFPIEALDAYKQIVNDNNVDLKWQKGDILLVDNLCAQHARRPGKQPRVVLVSLCK